MPLPANMTYLMMIKEAISSLKERGGSSLQAIKKYIHETYPDVDVQGHFLRSSLKRAVTNSELIQNKGSYKISRGEVQRTTKPKGKKTSTKKVNEEPKSPPKTKASKPASKPKQSKAKKVQLTEENQCKTCQEEIATWDVKLVFAQQGTLRQGKKQVLIDQEIVNDYDIAGYDLPCSIERGDFTTSMCDKCVAEVEYCTEFASYKKPKTKAKTIDDVPVEPCEEHGEDVCGSCSMKGSVYYESNMFLQFYSKTTGNLVKQRDCDDSHDRVWKCWKCLERVGLYNGDINITFSNPDSTTSS